MSPFVYVRIHDHTCLVYINIYIKEIREYKKVYE